MKQFIDKFCRSYNVSPHSLEVLIGEMDFAVFQKGEYIVRQGELNNNLYIIKKGIVRGFRNTEEEEVSVWFSTDATMVCQIWGYVSGARSELFVEAEEDTEVYFISKSDIDKLCSESLELSNLLRKMFESHALIIENELMIFADYADSSDRYLAIMKREPELLQRISLKKLASYLLITPQSLSRIRAGLKKKNNGK